MSKPTSLDELLNEEDNVAAGVSILTAAPLPALINGEGKLLNVTGSIRTQSSNDIIKNAYVLSLPDFSNQFLLTPDQVVGTELHVGQFTQTWQLVLPSAADIINYIGLDKLALDYRAQNLDIINVGALVVQVDPQQAVVSTPVVRIPYFTTKVVATWDQGNFNQGALIAPGDGTVIRTNDLSSTESQPNLQLLNDDASAGRPTVWTLTWYILNTGGMDPPNTLPQIDIVVNK